MESTDALVRSPRLRNLLRMGVLLAVLLGVVGFRQGWFRLTTIHQAGGSNLDVPLKGDADRAKVDSKSMSHIKSPRILAIKPFLWLGRRTMLSTVLIVLLVLALLGAFPNWNHSRDWGYGPSGVIGLI